MLCRVFHTIPLHYTKNRRRDFLIAHAAFYAVTQENHRAQNRWQVVNLTDRKGGPVVQGPTTTVRKVTGGAQGRPWPFCTAAVVMAMWVLAWEVWDAATTENVKFGFSSLSKNQKITRMIQVHCFSSKSHFITFSQWFVLALQIAQGLQMEFTICCLTWQCKKCVSFHRTGLFLVFVARCIDEGQYRGWHKVTRILLFNWLYVVSWFLRIFHMDHLSYWDWGYA